jgi:hypothetical protein
MTQRNGSNNGNHGSTRWIEQSGRPLAVPPESESQLPGPSVRKLNRRAVVGPSTARHFHPAPEQLEFRAFEDGTLVDLVRDAAAPEVPSLLISKHGSVRIQKEFHHADKIFVPRLVEPSLFAAVRLPTGIVRSPSTREIFRDLEDCMSMYIDIERNQQHLVATFVMCTWFQDLLPVAPYLWLTGPYGSGKTTLLRLLDCLCRRSVMAGDVTPAALYSLPSALMPTLMIDEFEFEKGTRNRDLQRLLRMGSMRGGRVVRSSRLYETFCAKAISSRQQPPDAALASRAVFVSMLPTSKSLSQLCDVEMGRIAENFQPRLLSYRVENYDRIVTGTRRSVPDFTPRMKSLAASLAAPLLGEKEMERELFHLLGLQDHEARVDLYGEREWAVAAGLYEECHGTTGALTMGNLSDTVNSVLAANGETYSIKPRAVGELVRSFGIATEQLGNQGRGLRLTRATIRAIHALAHRFGLKRSNTLSYATADAGYGGFPCAVCEEYGLMIREDGSHLKCVNLLKPRRRGSLYD